MSETQVVKKRPATSKPKSKKRRQDDESGSRKRRKPTAYEEDEEYLDLDAGVNKKIALVDNLLLADHLAKKIRRFGTELKHVELSQLDISRMFSSFNRVWTYMLIRSLANYITDTTSFQEIRTLENLPNFLEKFADPKKLGEAPKQNGSPHTLIVTGAGLRAADLVRYEFIFMILS